MISRIQRLMEAHPISSVGKWLHYLINAYLLYAIIQQGLLSITSLYMTIELGASLPLFLGSLLVVTLSFEWLSNKFSFLGKPIFTHLLLAIYVTGGILKSPSLMVVFGFLLLSCGIYAKLCFDASPIRGWFLILLLLTLPKVVYLIYNPYINLIERFVIQTDSWDYSRLWLVLIMVIYAILAVALLRFLAKKSPVLLASTKVERWLATIILITIALYVTYLAVVSAFTIKIFSVSTFDIGIFTQMFEGMKRTLLPITTLERDKVLSHFAVHISPIFYLLLPFYYFFPYGETLEVLQILIVFSGVFPLYLIIKELQLPSKARWLGILLFAVTPAMTTGGSYHIHENCFLVPLLLWLIYANIKQWKVGSWVFSVLTLMVKEDAFIYVISVACFFLLQSRFELKKEQRIRMILSQILLPLLCFGFGMYYLNQFGDGVMVHRYENLLLPDQKGLLSILSNVVQNPTYTFASFFTQSKLHFIVITFAAQIFLPLIQKDWAAYALLLPLVAINLLSDNIYQSNINFQYSYGTSVLLLFMAFMAMENLVLTFKSNKEVVKLLPYSLLIVSILISTGVTYSYTHSKYRSVVDYYNNRQELNVIHYTLDQIPKDKKIVAFTGYTVALREVAELYDIFYHNDRQVDESMDFVVMKRELMDTVLADGQVPTEVDVVNRYFEAGYVESSLSSEKVLILEKSQ